MAQGTNYKVAFRRRREGKTDYGARIKLIDYEKSRLVVRISNAQATVQIVDYKTRLSTFPAPPQALDSTPPSDLQASSEPSILPSPNPA